MPNITGPAGAHDDANPLGGILGSILGESPAAQKARIEEAAKGANDLTGLVRKKQPATSKQPQANGAAAAEGAAPTSTKRKAEDDGEGESGKKVKV